MIYGNTYNSFLQKDYAPRRGSITIRYRDFLDPTDSALDAVTWCIDHFRGRPWDWNAVRFATPVRHCEIRCNSIFYFQNSDDAILFRLAQGGDPFTVESSQPFNISISNIRRNHDI